MMTIQRIMMTGGLMAALTAVPVVAQPQQDWQDPLQFAFQRPVVAMPGMMSRSFLGVHVVEIDTAKAQALKLPDEVGVEITGVEPDSPAEKAGLKLGDVVVEYQGQRVEGTEQFIRLVRETPVGRQVKMGVHRAGAALQTLTATIGARKGPRVIAEGAPHPPRIEIPRMEMWMPDMPRAYSGMRSSRLGVEAESVGGQLAEFFGVKAGVLVRSVAKASAAEKGGLKAGDVITKVDQKPVDSPRDLSDMLRENREAKSMAVTVMRDKHEMTLNVTPEQERNSAERPARAVVQDYRF